MEYHVPALLTETIDGLNIKPNGIYVDATFGGGGHSRAILEKIKNGCLFGFDQDLDAKNNIPDDDRFVFVRNNYRFMKNYLRFYGFEKVDGILADLGVSFHHFDTAERGFSFRFNEALDMRMDQDSELTAAHILNTYSREDLVEMFKKYGELKNAQYLTEKIMYTRSGGAIKTGEDLKAIALQVKPSKVQENKYLAQIFQALRIEVNEEMLVLKELLNSALELLNPGGRLVVITYHSLEDRLVKQFIKSGNVEGEIKKDFYGNIESKLVAVNRKVIVPGEDEIERNPRSRSAKLRIAEKL